jgi:hypothetical protein
MVRATDSIPDTKIDPSWVTGFSEGTRVSIARFKRVWLFYRTGLNERDTNLLYRIQSFFAGVGVISFEVRQSTYFTVADGSDLANIIVPHFNRFQLVGRNYLIIFFGPSKILNFVTNGAPQTPSGLAQIKELRYQLNK